MQKTQSTKMKTHIIHECEICNKKYHSIDDAKECEAKGKFDPSKFPTGLMFEYHHNGYVGIFAIPEPIEQYKYDPHLGHGSYWACRDYSKFGGDSIGNEQCGGDFFHSDDEWVEGWRKGNRITNKRVNGDEFKRMVKFLQSQGINPTYYDAHGNLILVQFDIGSLEDVK